MNGQQELNDALQRVVRPSQNYYDRILQWSAKWINDPLGLRSAGFRFTSEILRDSYEFNNPWHTPDEHRVYGAVIKALQSEGKIRHVGYTKATNKQAHCRPISVWEVV
jgi:hypothetical protein